MRISRIRISNFRNFREFDVAIGDHAVIVGENKIGKTNLLFALRLVLDPGLPDSSRYLDLDDFNDGLPRPLADDETIEISVDLTDFEDDDAVFALLCDHLIEPETMTARLTYRAGASPGHEESSGLRADFGWTIFGGGRVENTVSSDVRRRLPMSVLQALRDAERDLSTWIRSPLRRLLEDAAQRMDRDDLDEIAEGVSDSEAKMAGQEAIQGLASRISDELVRMVGPHHAIDTSLQLAPKVPEYLVRALRLFVDNGRRPIAEASLGSANLLYLALRNLELQLTVQSDRQDAAILAIEEPEAHLQPHVQRLVYRGWLRPQPPTSEDGTTASQIPLLLTTHSPHITSVAPLRSLVLLKQDPENGATIGRSAVDCDLDFAEVDDLERYLDVTRAEMLFSRGIVFVEGESEKYLIPKFAELLGIDLDSYGITVCSVSGVNFAPYLKFSGPTGLDLPYVVLTDGDPQSDGTALGENRLVRLLSVLSVEIDADVVIRSIGREKGIFLNDTTLELELAHGPALAKMCSTLIETTSNGATKNRAEGWREAPDSLDESRFLKDVEAVGKGRFAQRLCARLEVDDCPEYIQAALVQIRDACGQ